MAEAGDSNRKGLFGLDVNKTEIIIVIMLTTLLASLDQTIVATAMPTVIKDLGGLDYMSLVFAGYMTASIITITISGKLGDLRGRKNIYLYGIAIFTLGSFLCGFSQDMAMLIAFRTIQGAGAGMLIVLAVATMGDLFSPAERGKWIGLVVAVYGLASIIGPMIGAIITETIGWRWVFFVNVPIGILTYYLLYKAKDEQAINKNAKIDVMGSIFFAVFIIAIMAYTGMGMWPLTTKMIIVLAIAVISLVLFIQQEKKAPEAILPLSLFENRIFKVAAACSFVLGAVMFSVISFIPQYVETVLGGGAMDAGKALTPLLLTSVITTIVAGNLVSHFGRYKLLAVAATILTFIGIALITDLNENSSYHDVVIALIIFGAGLGPQIFVYTLVVQNVFDDSNVGLATSSVTFFRSLGAAIGVAVTGAIIATASNVSEIVTEADRLAYINGMQTAFMLSVLLSAACVIVICSIDEIPLRKRKNDAGAAIG